MIVIRNHEDEVEISVYRSGLLALRAFNLVYFDRKLGHFYITPSATLDNVYDMLGCISEDYK